MGVTRVRVLDRNPAEERIVEFVDLVSEDGLSSHPLNESRHGEIEMVDLVSEDEVLDLRGHHHQLKDDSDDNIGSTIDARAKAVPKPARSQSHLQLGIRKQRARVQKSSVPVAPKRKPRKQPRILVSAAASKASEDSEAEEGWTRQKLESRVRHFKAAYVPQSRLPDRPSSAPQAARHVGLKPIFNVKSPKFPNLHYQHKDGLPHSGLEYAPGTDSGMEEESRPEKESSGPDSHSQESSGDTPEGVSRASSMRPAKRRKIEKAPDDSDMFIFSDVSDGAVANAIAWAESFLSESGSAIFATPPDRQSSPDSRIAASEPGKPARPSIENDTQTNPHTKLPVLDSETSFRTTMSTRSQHETLTSSPLRSSSPSEVDLSSTEHLIKDQIEEEQVGSPERRVGAGSEISPTLKTSVSTGGERRRLSLTELLRQLSGIRDSFKCLSGSIDRSEGLLAKAGAHIKLADAGLEEMKLGEQRRRGTASPMHKPETTAPSTAPTKFEQAPMAAHYSIEVAEKSAPLWIELSSDEDDEDDKDIALEAAVSHEEATLVSTTTAKVPAKPVLLWIEISNDEDDEDEIGIIPIAKVQRL